VLRGLSRRAVGLLTVGLVGAVTPALSANAATTAKAARPVLAYVANAVDASVLPLNVVTNTFGPPIRVGLWPDAIVFAPNGKTAYVADGGPGALQRPTHTVAVIDTTTGRRGRFINVAPQPFALAITPDGKTVYALSPTGVTPISTATKQPGELIKVGKDPDSMALTPNGTTLYVANGGSSTVTPISTATGKAGRPIRVGSGPGFLAVSPDGRAVVVVGSGSVTVIRAATNTAGKPVPLSGDLSGVVFAPDGKTAYVAADRAKVGLWVIPMSVTTSKLGKPIKVAKPSRWGTASNYEAITPNGKTLYVTDYWEFTVTPVSLSSGKPGKPIHLPNNAYGLWMTPGGATAYVSTGALDLTAISTSTEKIITTLHGAGGPMAMEP
jgi:YVTN family beta-propeller protein